LLFVGCAQIRYGQTSLGQALNGSITIPAEWGEIYCGQGAVCAEVEVVRVDFENRDGGRIEVTLHNRTASQVAVQVGIEILAPNGSKLDTSRFSDVPLAPRQESGFEMPGIYKKGGKIRISLRTR
jgi:hypothetical protein